MLLRENSASDTWQVTDDAISNVVNNFPAFAQAINSEIESLKNDGTLTRVDPSAPVPSPTLAPKGIVINFKSPWTIGVIAGAVIVAGVLAFTILKNKR